MSWLNVFWARLRALFGRESVISDIDEELRLHVELETEENLARGMSPAEARRAARMSFGNFDSIRDTAYTVRGGGLMETFLQDVRYGVRVLLKNKGFTAVAVLALALGIGANTAIFSVVKAVLLSPLPYPAPDRLVWLREVNPSNDIMDEPASAPNYNDWRTGARSFEAVAAYAHTGITLTGEGEPERVPGSAVSANYFQVLGVAPALGRG